MANNYYAKKRRYKIKYNNVALLLAVFLMLILLIGKGCSAIFSHKDDEPKKQPDTPIVSGDQPQGEIPNAATDPTKQNYYHFTTLTREKSDIGEGTLVLVNNNIAYTGKLVDSDLVTVREMKNKAYSVKDYSVKLLPVAMDALNDMLLDFYNVTSNDGVHVNAGHRTVEYQQELYADELKQTGQESSTLVAKPGYSEHHTGLVVDFTTYQNGKYIKYDGTGDFEWINLNCYKYGYINRYPLGKESLTLIDNEPWHFRYVGVPHATVMQQRNLCLEEYIDFIKNYTISTGFLEVTTADGSRYMIYFTPDSGKDTTKIYIPVTGPEPGAPTYPYEISGNNVDGWIVTFLYEKGAGVPDVVPTPDPAATAAPENDGGDATPEAQPET